eukprot:tig00020800_g13744.t1
MFGKLASISKAVGQITKDVLADEPDEDELSDLEREEQQKPSKPAPAAPGSVGAEQNRSETSELRERLRASEEHVQKLSREYGKLLTEKEREITGLKQERDKLKEQRDQSGRAVASKSPTSEGDWQTDSALANGLESSLEAAEAEIDRLSSLLSKAEEEIKRLREAAGDSVIVQELKARLEREAAERQKEVDSLADHFREQLKLHQAASSHNQEAELARLEAEDAKNRQVIGELREELERLRGELEGRDKAHVALERKLADEEERVRRLKQQLDIACSAAPGGGAASGSGGAAPKEATAGWEALRQLLEPAFPQLMRPAGGSVSEEAEALGISPLVLTIERIKATVQHAVMEREGFEEEKGRWNEEAHQWQAEVDRLNETAEGARKELDKAKQEAERARQEAERARAAADSEADKERSAAEVEVERLRGRERELQAHVEALQLQLQSASAAPAEGAGGRDAALAKAQEDVRRLLSAKGELEAANAELQDEVQKLQAEVRRVAGMGAEEGGARDPRPRPTSAPRYERGAARRAAGGQRAAGPAQLQAATERAGKQGRALERLQADLVDKDRQLEQMAVESQERDARLADLEKLVEVSRVKEEATSVQATRTINQLHSDLERLKIQFAEKEAEAERNATAAANLQMVLDQFQHDHEEGVKAELKRLGSALQAALDEGEHARARHREAAERAETASSEAAAVRVELEARQAEVVTLRAEAERMRRGLEEGMRRLNTKETEAAELIDRRLVNKLVVSYIGGDGKTQRDVLMLMAKILGFTDAEKERVGLLHRDTWSRLIGSKGKDELENANLADMWVEFLRTEVDEDEAAKANSKQLQSSSSSRSLGPVG